MDFLSKIREVINESDFYFHSRSSQAQSTVEEVCKTAYKLLKEAEARELQQKEVIERLSTSNRELSTQLALIEYKKADRSVQEKALVSLLQRAKALFGPVVYSGPYGVMEKDQKKMKAWLYDLSALFISHQYPFKEEKETEDEIL